MMNVHPIIAAMVDEDPDVRDAMRGLKKPVYGLSEIIADGPHGRTILYEHKNSGLLKTFLSNGRRFALAIDYARYLVALSRIGKIEDQRHHLAKAENRPAHDPKSQRQVAA